MYYEKINKYCNKFKDHTPSELLGFVNSKYPEWTVKLARNI